MSLLRLNFMMVVFHAVLFLLLFGSTNGEGAMTTEYFNGFTMNGVQYYVQKHDELIFYAERGTTASTWYCTKIDALQCRSGEIQFYDKMLELDPSMGEWNSQIFKNDIAVFYPTEVSDRWFYIDIFTFNFAVNSLFSTTAQHLKILFTIDVAIALLRGIRPFFQYQVIFEDPENLCSRASVYPHQMLNYNLYVNRRSNKHSYYFIKDGNKICVYTLKHEDLFHVRQKADTTAPTIHSLNFDLIEIDTFETENYAPNFHCVDPLYGTFVALYWDKEYGHLPEAHYYLIDEKNLQNFTLIDKNPLPGFDEAVLKAIFNSEFDSFWSPMFQSYGRQIFVWFKLRNVNRAFHGLWKDKDYYKAAFETVDSVPDKQIKWHARKDWIKYGAPVGRFDGSELPSPVPLNVNQPRPVVSQEPTTLPSPTTTKRTTALPPTAAAPSTHPSSATASTSVPSRLPSSAAPSGTIQTSTPSPAMTTVENATSDSSNTTYDDSNFNQTSSSTVPESNKNHAAPFTGNEECTNNDLYLYLLIVIIVIIVFEVIVLVILIIFKSRGAKKMKEAMTRKKFSKSKKSIKKKKPSREGKKKKGKMPWTKESKKSTTEKAAAGSKTEDAATGKTAEEKTAEKSGKRTDYYTVDEKFNKSSKKKNKK